MFRGDGAGHDLANRFTLESGPQMLAGVSKTEESPLWRVSKLFKDQFRGAS